MDLYKETIHNFFFGCRQTFSYVFNCLMLMVIEIKRDMNNLIGIQNRICGWRLQIESVMNVAGYPQERLNSLNVCGIRPNIFGTKVISPRWRIYLTNWQYCHYFVIMLRELVLVIQ